MVRLIYGHCFSMHVRAVIPHFFKEADQGQALEIGEGFGCRQPGSRRLRSLSLQRCLLGLLNLQRSLTNAVLNLQTACAEEYNSFYEIGLPSTLSLEVIVVIHSQKYCLDDILLDFSHALRVLPCPDIDPRCLGIRARDYLIRHPSPADLNIYLEDDLVVSDPFFLDKITWFADLMDQDAILLPHRYELRASLSSAQRLLIDGPIDASAIESWHHPASNAVMASYCNGPMISFDRPQNPHSGFFGLTRQQLHHLRDKSLPVSGFVGPLETAATYTAGKYFHLYKPSLKHSLFLLIEHSSPSFLGYWSQNNGD